MSMIAWRRRDAKLTRRANLLKYEALIASKGKLNLKKLDFVLKDKAATGTHTSIYLVEGLNEHYGRQNLCFKVFEHSKHIWGNVSKQGKSPIVESAKVQNLMALRGLAPRIYEIVEVDGKTAFVTDYLVGEQKVVPISDDRFEWNEGELTKDYNFVAGKFVDFQAVVFKDYQGYCRSVLDRARSQTQWPLGHSGLYQSLSYFPGKRDTSARLKRYQFKDFEKRMVLDIGCNIGSFCREALRLGAKRVCGLDLPKIAEIAAELAILDGIFNIDFYGVDLKTLSQADLEALTGIKKFDIHLFLAMEEWVGWPVWAKNCGTLYYEGHGVERPYKVEHFK